MPQYRLFRLSGAPVLLCGINMISAESNAVMASVRAALWADRAKRAFALARLAFGAMVIADMLIYSTSDHAHPGGAVLCLICVPLVAWRMIRILRVG